MGNFCKKIKKIDMRFLLFSKTMHDESPRIRHQLADLLTSNGHFVIFYQRPAFIFNRSQNLVNKKINESLQILQTRQLIHHQLRVWRWIANLNAAYERQSISKSVGNITDGDVIINFNYDYYFLRRIFKNNKIITLINDDFVAQAKFFAGRHVDRALRATAQNSDAVLTVSTPLLQQSLHHTSRAELFLPWTVDSYERPKENLEKNAVLLWAHIDRRIDFNLLDFIVKNNPSYHFYLVGPIGVGCEEDIKKLVFSRNNIVQLESAGLAKLPLERFFCSIIPYRAGVGDIEAVTASNKTFQLMSKGLPLITYGMPHFLEHPAIFKAGSYQEFSDFLDVAKTRFWALQEQIAELIVKNRSDDRYAMIMNIVNKNK